MRLITVCVGALLLTACSQTPGTNQYASQRMVNDAEYMELVEQAVRDRGSNSVKVYWVNPPKRSLSQALREAEARKQETNGG